MCSCRKIFDAERQRILTARGTMTAAAAGKLFDRNECTIMRVWKSAPGYVPFRRFTATELSPRETIAVDLMRASGDAGVLLSEIVAKVHDEGWVASANTIQSSFTYINGKFERSDLPDRVKRISNGNKPARYALVAVPAVEPETVSEPTVDVDWTPSIPSVSRRITGDLGLGSTPGAIGSVARVSFLDGHA
jgi:hypothetical protein